MSLRRIAGPLGIVLALVTLIGAADDKPGDPPRGPNSPREELATFKIAPGFKVELVACEPEVIDPVASAFDENGRLYVAEMIAYPNGGIARGDITSGRIKLLTDENGDGYYEKAVVFADGLRLPTSVMPWKNGLLAAVAPDLLYLEDTDGDGKADKKRVLYTGFDLANIQQLVSGLQWGLDNWVYACAGGKGGTILSGEKKDADKVELRGRGIRFHPGTPGSLEPMSGGGQFGLAADDWQHWFTSTNSQHLKQIVLPDHYLRRNPYLAVGSVTVNIPDHGPACKVHRISPFEAWRVERTARRKGQKKRGFPSTELVAGGYITSACSPIVYTGERFPAPFRDCVYICDPANNLIHRDRLEPKGALFVAKRADADCEFLASTDNWFRPTSLTLGPDAALYVTDFYREVIETPLSLPEDIKKKLNLESRSRGRIWRIRPDDKFKARKPALRQAKSADLVKHLDDASSFWRFNAQRLLVERQDKQAVEPLRKLARSARRPQGKAHALWTLRGLKALDDASILAALGDNHPGVRAQAVRLSEARLDESEPIRQAVAKLVDDPDFDVRFQLAFSLGASKSPAAADALARLVRKEGSDAWMQRAILSSSEKNSAGLLASLVKDKKFIAAAKGDELKLLTQIAALVGARRDDAGLARTLALFDDKEPAAARWQLAVLGGLGSGMQNSQRSLARIWDKPSPELKKAVANARTFFVSAARTAADAKQPLADRLDAARLLGFGPPALAEEALPGLLTPQNPAELQLAAVRALAAQDHPKLAELLLPGWAGYGPSLRREVLEVVFARPDRLDKLLDAIEKKQVRAGQMESARIDQLKKHPSAKLRARATKLLAGIATPARAKIVASYQKALDLEPDITRGKAVFKKNCAVCHRYDDVGVEVGADLQAAMRNKTPAALLIDILDPSREVDPRFINYVVTTSAGKQYTGVIAVETPTSLTLRRAEKAEDTILRNQIEEVVATTKSIMPEELEKQLTPQDAADVIAYLLSRVGKK